MIRRAFCFPLVLLLAVLAGGAHAHPEGRWRDLPPEERRELRQQMREQWRKTAERGQGRASRGDALPPEERQRLRDEMREQHRQFPERGERRHRH